MPPLIDILARCMRQSRLGNHGGKWDALPDATRDDWRSSATVLVELLEGCGWKIVRREEVGE